MNRNLKGWPFEPLDGVQPMGGGEPGNGGFPG